MKHMGDTRFYICVAVNNGSLFEKHPVLFFSLFFPLSLVSVFVFLVSVGNR